MSYVIYVCDTETTGLDNAENDIIEISLWRSSDEDQKTWCVKPVNAGSISDKALQVNGHKKEDILWKTAEGRERYRDPADVVSEIEVWMMGDNVTVEDRIFVAQNPDFDIPFMRRLWEKAGAENTYPFGSFVLDTIQIVRFVDMCTGKRRSRYNLSSLVKAFGISKSKAHRAADDVKMTKDLLLTIMNPIKDVIADNFKDSYME